MNSPPTFLKGISSHMNLKDTKYSSKSGMSALSGSSNKNHIYQQDAGQTVYELQEV